VTAGSFVLSPFQYVALAVLILGPGQHSSEFQQSAAIYDSITLLNALILRGAQIDDTLLSFAAYNESPHVVRRLIERGTPINERHYSTKVTALHKAVEGQRYENMELLLEAGANPNIADARGVTPLDLAMKLKDDKMLEMLKRVGSGRARER
jgi:ankyrin repeat protein